MHADTKTRTETYRNFQKLKMDCTHLEIADLNIVMRFFFGGLFSVALLAGFVFGQAPLGDPAPETAGPRRIDLTPDPSGTVPAQQIRELLQRAEQKDLQNDKRQRDYTYIERVDRHQLDGHGNVKKVDTWTSEILEIYGEPVVRLTTRNDKPLSANEARKEDDKIQKIIDKRKHESEEDRRKRVEKEDKAREEDRKFVLEIADAFSFRLVGSEVIDGRDAWVLEGDPRPGYQPQRRDARLLSKFRGRVWIDKSDLQWVKLDITAVDTVSIGFVLARIHKGTHLVIDMTRVNDEVWLPRRVQLHFDARVALFKSYDDDVEQTYRDYKKFRTDSKMTVVGEPQ